MYTIIHKYWTSLSILLSKTEISVYTEIFWGQDSAVGIATRYGLDGPGIKSRWGRHF